MNRIANANWPHDGRIEEERTADRLADQLKRLEEAAEFLRRKEAAESRAADLRKQIEKLGVRPVA